MAQEGFSNTGLKKKLALGGLLLICLGQMRGKDTIMFERPIMIFAKRAKG
jgi:hypothetical protein